MKRHKHSLSHYKLATFNMGELTPVGCYEVLPGDSIMHSTSALIRVSPLVAPVMHPVSVRIHHWFVPNRILWDEWETFITGETSNPPPNASFPTGVAVGSLPDYMGVPPSMTSYANMFPMMAYNLIWNEFYRDQDLQAEVDELNLELLPVAWDKDYFTTARPWEQKGPEVTLPLGTAAPVIRDPNALTDYPTFNDPTGGTLSLLASGGNTVGWASPDTPSGGPLKFSNSGLVADLSNASAVNVNEVRRAFAIQRYQEARALYGSRYTEYLAYLGVKSSDARLQRPEYLGGGKSVISFSEILKTGSGESPTVPLGAMVGHGISAQRSRTFRKFFEEHGHVITLASVRPRSIYATGMHKLFSRYTKEDYWQKELEFIGQQPIHKSEVYASGSGTFGYGDRYSEYRSHPSTIAGEFRTTLNNWHFARQFAAEPVLNADFIECDPGTRPFADQTPKANHLWGMFNHSIRARRMVANSSVGRII